MVLDELLRTQFAARQSAEWPSENLEYGTASPSNNRKMLDRKLGNFADYLHGSKDVIEDLLGSITLFSRLWFRCTCKNTGPLKLP
jgi:hypothetical protein